MRDKIIDYMAHVTGCERSDCELCFDAMLQGARDEGFVLVPAELTAENGMKYALLGEFSERVEAFDGDGASYTTTVDVTWPTIKALHRAVVKAAPKLEKNTEALSPTGAKDQINVGKGD